MEGKLFSQDFLLHGITTTPAWESVSATQLDAFQQALSQLFAPLKADSVLNEANTEADFIEKVLDLLDWQGARSRSEEFLEIDLAALFGLPGIEQSLFGGGDIHNQRFDYGLHERRGGGRLDDHD